MQIQFMVLPAHISLRAKRDICMLQYYHRKAWGRNSVQKSMFLGLCVCSYMSLFVCQGDLASVQAIYVKDADWEN